MRVRILNNRRPPSPNSLGEGYFRPDVQRERDTRVNSREIECTPVLPMSPPGGENFVIKLHKNTRFPKTPLVVWLRRQWMEGSSPAERDKRPGYTRRATAMHSEH